MLDRLRKKRLEQAAKKLDMSNEIHTNVMADQESPITKAVLLKKHKQRIVISSDEENELEVTKPIISPPPMRRSSSKLASIAGTVPNDVEVITSDDEQKATAGAEFEVEAIWDKRHHKKVI